jgi:hypothetical protein
LKAFVSFSAKKYSELHGLDKKKKDEKPAKQKKEQPKQQPKQEKKVFNSTQV